MAKNKFREVSPKFEVKLILGRDAEGNDELVKKFKGKTNTILHTVAPGSPFCVIQNPLKPTAEDIYLAALLCAKYSQTWRDKKSDVKVNIFTGKDVSKPKDAKIGTWQVKTGKSKTITVKKDDILKFEGEK